MKKRTIIIICVLAAILTVAIFALEPSIRGFFAAHDAKVREAEDRTSYEVLKKVEDSARSMIATYKRDKVEYESNLALFEETKDVHYREVAEGYKAQANQTAATYNEYVVKNKHVWKNAVPDDIFMSLEYIQ